MASSTITPQTLQAALSGLVGGRRAWVASGADAVAGVQPLVVVEPATEEEVAAALAFADREGLAVAIRGGGTQLGLGAPPSNAEMLLSMAGMHRVIEHTAGDLTATFEAGVGLAQAQDALAAAGQWLALDPALPPTATIGGILATRASGPRRLRYGGPRDQVIGVRIVRADGTIAKGGGKVVKNVAGYDLPRLFTGSLGTLGVIVSATFRLYPVAVASRTVVLSAPEPAPLCTLAVRTNATTLVPSAIDVVGGAAGEPCRMLVRFESLEEAAIDQAQALLDLAGGLAAAGRIISGSDEAEAWRQAAERVLPGTGSAGAGATMLLHASILPTDVAAWLAGLKRVAEQAHLTTQWTAHAGHGLIAARLTGAEAALVAAVPPLREAATQRQGSLVVQDAPPSLARQVDVWGPVAALEQMRRLKGFFDPHGTLNPGRFVGGV